MSHLFPPFNQKITISDLMISVKNGRILLRSKKYNKEVMPCLSNAHNYSNNSLPIYHFLGDLQMQNTKPVSSFGWGILESHYSYFPRVLYKNIILSKAKWMVTKSELDIFANIADNELLNAFQKWKNNRNIPQYVTWVKHDNTLLLDLEQLIGIQLLLSSVKNYHDIMFEEFLFEKETLVRDELENGYANQCILSFYKE